MVYNPHKLLYQYKKVDLVTVTFDFMPKRISTTVDWQGYQPNVVFIQGYRYVEDSYYVTNVTKKK